MRKYIYMLLTAALFVACDSEDDISLSGNANANMQVRSGVTEKPAEVNCKSMARRVEVPSLNNGAEDLFVVHTTSCGVNYIMEYDCGKMASRWIAYQWHRGNSGNAWNRNNWRSGYTFNGYGGKGDPFQPDPLIPSYCRMTESSYSGTGYQRGHMLASADRLASQECNGQTFYMSNMHPQLPGFNSSGIWYNLEGYIRNNYNKDSFRDTLYIVKGGTIAEGQYNTVMNSGVQLLVPKYFYMAILCKNSKAGQGGYKAIAFWMEHKANTDSNYAAYAVSIDELEKKTGIDFFCNLPDDIESQVESNMVLSAWGLK